MADNARDGEAQECPTHGVCPPCREGWGHWNGREYVPTIQSETARVGRGNDIPDVVCFVPGLMAKADPVGPPLALVLATLGGVSAFGYALGRWLS